MALIYWGKGTSPTTFIQFLTHSSSCDALLDTGIRRLLLDMGQKSILHYSVIKASNLASMASLSLLSDITGQAPDIRDSYWQYLNYLVSFFVKLLLLVPLLSVVL